ncbi:MAG: hypothetical protein UV71_C0006G0021 [Microgenomates group bacterium GW2011_GWC1_43_13]|uniref:Type 4 fimbrial biogenesis protein PilX N-terminal domain-containing protein n=3 Tax=Candidatus Woeseibacteriota TaxID=1752722 RepID=A0A837IBQ3_9BACT|nr:MAG: hypothetical protein UV71_C0006G0021 [Microgenomates group bacterium GW2011_GWC1_43_13]KKT32560.1 MAG: hypothetical protein UW20_C0012G0006 [Candidatus Woesebacteria bacterium GW2011_GWB1_44_11]KKT54291.1 MAG: hypothetical protein UW47_C0007G0011 [Candidatus Woesebacteria bacterium GW2011_GWA1_44_23]OGM76672.1 MAG: hypothetical protein A2208_03125 [Candidatus Woesebacteria bacterium RIFOXYA1_FULL_43_16]OGM83167.1 MAG: hypothetical protein A2394_02680 [Candidatus Woesebacteria bacterium 
MRKGEYGQALVLVLLSLSVVLTLILYILSRSVTDVAVSSRQEEAVRAFSAAEAGIERALVTGADYSGVEIGNAQYTTTTTDFASGSYGFSFPSPISSGDTVTVWFVSHDENGNLICDATHPCYTGDTIEICWGNSQTDPNSPNTPAIEASVYYNDADQPTLVKVGRVAIDPYAGRRETNSFDLPQENLCQIGDQTFAFHKTINFVTDLAANPAGLQFAQLKMFYNSDTRHNIGVRVTGDTLPSQGKQIDSSGVAGDSNRRVVVYQGWPEFTFASNALISPFGIIQ